MTAPPGAEAVLAPLIADAAGSALMTDFDGTISPIVTDPSAARPLPEALELLHLLAALYRCVAVVSGRPASFLAHALELDRRQSGLIAIGLYGLEQAGADGRVETLGGESWRRCVADVASEASARAPTGVDVEPKGLTLTLHWRRAALEHPADAETIAAEGRALAADLATSSGLELRIGRKSVELAPPTGVDKGSVVRRLSGGSRGALFAGDDVGDLPGYAAIDSLPATHGVKVAVASDEAPPELLEGADFVVDGPAGMVDVLRLLSRAS